MMPTDLGPVEATQFGLEFVSGGPLDLPRPGVGTTLGAVRLPCSSWVEGTSTLRAYLEGQPALALVVKLSVLSAL